MGEREATEINLKVVQLLVPDGLIWVRNRLIKQSNDFNQPILATFKKTDNQQYLQPTSCLSKDVLYVIFLSIQIHLRLAKNALS